MGQIKIKEAEFCKLITATIDMKDAYFKLTCKFQNISENIPNIWEGDAADRAVDISEILGEAMSVSQKNIDELMLRLSYALQEFKEYDANISNQINKKS